MYLWQTSLDKLNWEKECLNRETAIYVDYKIKYERKKEREREKERKKKCKEERKEKRKREKGRDGGGKEGTIYYIHD